MNFKVTLRLLRCDLHKIKNSLRKLPCALYDFRNTLRFPKERKNAHLSAHGHGHTAVVHH